MKASEILERIEQDKKSMEFLPTGLIGLDKHLDGGFLKKEIVILGAFTGIGKSIFAGQIFLNIVKNGFHGAYFSLEISKEMIVSRLVGGIANIKPTRIMSGGLKPEELDGKLKAKANLTIYDGAMEFYDNLYFFEEIRKEILENKFEFVVIDFIQNMLIKKNMDEYARLSHIAVQLQKLAKEADCCILVLSQLSNAVNKMNTKPTEYKGSGGIAMVADLGFFLERKDIKEDSIELGEQQISLLLRKNRRGSAGVYWNLVFEHPGGEIHEPQD